MLRSRVRKRRKALYISGRPSPIIELRRLRGVGLEPDGAEVVARGQADVSVQCGGEAAEQGDGGLGAAFLDALDLISGHLGELGDGEAQGSPDVVQGLAEGQCLA